MAEITWGDCKIETDDLKRSFAKVSDSLGIAAERASKIIGEWATTTSSLPTSCSWTITKDEAIISYGKENQNLEIVDLETKIEDAIDNVVMLIKAAKPHDEESLRDRIRCGIEEAFRVEEKSEPKPTKTVVCPAVPPVVEITDSDHSITSESVDTLSETLAAATKEYERTYTKGALTTAILEESVLK